MAPLTLRRRPLAKAGKKAPPVESMDPAPPPPPPLGSPFGPSREGGSMVSKSPSPHGKQANDHRGEKKTRATFWNELCRKGQKGVRVRKMTCAAVLMFALVLLLGLDFVTSPARKVYSKSFSLCFLSLHAAVNSLRFFIPYRPLPSQSEMQAAALMPCITNRRKSFGSPLSLNM